MDRHSHEDLAKYLRCLVYELYVLATATERMITASDKDLAEVCKTAALVKLRAVYDFFHRPGAIDTIKLSMFDCYSTRKPALREKNWDRSLTHQSINTYIVHLDKERIVGTVPQPKFSRGEFAVLRTAVTFMKEAKEFVESVKHDSRSAELNRCGKRWWSAFVPTLDRLDALVRQIEKDRNSIP